MPSEMADRFSFLLFILSISLIITLCVHFERENLAGPQPLPFYEVCEITGEVTADSKDIKGGREFFPFRILKYKGVDITEILQTSSFTIITEGKTSFIKVRFSFWRKDLFKNESKIIFVKTAVSYLCDGTILFKVTSCLFNYSELKDWSSWENP